ncbi:MAG: 2-amino-4-hydroxy-6-hydroxymethyldihydropteridine diphosphokinase [Calditrichia bacterium]
MSRAFLALGSNVPPRLTFLRRAIAKIREIGEIQHIAALYESEPFGVRQQPGFLNSAIDIETQLSPEDLLKAVKSIEEKTGRKQRFRWGPREIDIDIIFYGQQLVNLPDLQIPHPDYRQRRFVLQPLCDIAADVVAPDARQTLHQLLENCPDTALLRHLQTNWTTNGTEL